MQPNLSTFLQAAMDVGLADRLAVLRDDVERAIDDFPPGGGGWRVRLEGQRARLRSPDLDLVVRLVGVLCDEDPSRRARIIPVARSLKAQFPVLAKLAS
ncbi:hypothetical protein [Caulobacter segnis]|uniref:Uncharacterized protein n=1 Tax=Caulobacter segnis TaxID=88688 RepID=A0A2W5UXR9_9CAUL|nr:hypothetical protein [Caulobacter segnis]PZR31712.1 MAG: hypothetical protein DI526_18795 [Caulobacter segnis]